MDNKVEQLIRARKLSEETDRALVQARWATADGDEATARTFITVAMGKAAELAAYLKSVLNPTGGQFDD